MATIRALIAIVIWIWSCASLAQASDTRGTVTVTVNDCPKGKGSSMLRLYSLSQRTESEKPLVLRAGRYAASFNVPQGYYTANAIGRCSTPASNKPFVVLAQHARNVAIGVGSGIGLLLVGSVGLAGTIPERVSRVRLYGETETLDAVTGNGAYYFDYVSRGNYELREFNSSDREVGRAAVDLREQPLSTVKVLDL